MQFDISCKDNRHKDTWVTRDGEVLLISEMTTQHIENVIKLFGADNVPRAMLEEHYNRTFKGEIMEKMIQYTCPKCGITGAHPEDMKPPFCHKCKYRIEMKPSQNGKIINKER